MIRALLTGTLYSDPESRTAKSGKPYATVKLRADGKDGASVWCSLIAFGELADRLMTLEANAAVSVSGKAELSVWVGKDGNPAAGLSLVVDELATLKGKPRPPQGERAPPPRARTTPTPAPSPVVAEFDDALPEWV